MMKNQIRRMVTLTTILFAIFISVVHVNADSGKTDGRFLPSEILLLSSYDITNEWSTKIEKSLFSFFLTHGNICVQAEYLDLDVDRNYDILQSKADTLMNKYAASTPRIVVLVGEDAWIFYRHFLGGRSWRKTPCIAIFSGTSTICLNDYMENTDRSKATPISLEASRHGINATILYDPMFPEECIKLAMQLQHGMENIAFISDYREVSNVARDKVITAIKENHPDINFIDLTMRKFDTVALKDTIRNLPPNTGMLFYSWYLPKHHQSLSNSANNMKQVIGKLTEYPIFTLYDAGVDNGFICGGHYITTKDEVNALYATVEQVMDGTQPSDIPVTEITGDNTYLNYAKLQQKGVPTELYPADAIYYEKPVDFFERYKGIILLCLIIAFLLLVIGAMIVYYNRKKLENARRLKQALETSDRIKSSFIANISHELRTPLNAIAGFADLMLEGGISHEEKREYREAIDTNKDLLLHLFSDIIDLSSIEANSMTYNSNIVHLHTLVTESVQLTARSMNVAISFDRSSSDHIILCDNTKLVKVMRYLLENAIKKLDGRNFEIAYSAPKHGKGMVEFSITFDSRRVSDEVVERLFDKFYNTKYQLDRFSSLELPLCKAFIEGMGGDIMFTSIPTGDRDARSAFHFTLPDIQPANY